MLYGASGSGKSSLVNAGLIPAAMRKGLPARARARPAARGRGARGRADRRRRAGRACSRRCSRPDDSAPRIVLSTEAFRERLREGCASCRPLLVFDQFEEVVTLFEKPGGRDLQRRIADLLVALLRDEVLPVKLLFSFREDYLAAVKDAPRRGTRARRSVAAAQPARGRDAADDHPRRRSSAFPTTTSASSRPSLPSGCARSSRTSFGSGRGEPLRGADGLPAALAVGRPGGAAGIAERRAGPPRGLPRRGARGVPARAQVSRRRAARPDGHLGGHAQRDLRREPDRARPGRGRASRDAALEQALDRLESESKLVRRERRRDLYLYEITSEFLVPWISRRRAELVRAQDRRRFRRRLLVMGPGRRRHGARDLRSPADRRTSARMRRRPIALHSGERTGEVARGRLASRLELGRPDPPARTSIVSGWAVSTPRRPSAISGPRAPSPASRSARTGARSRPPATTGRSCSGTPRTTTASSRPSTAAKAPSTGSRSARTGARSRPPATTGRCVLWDAAQTTRKLRALDSGQGSVYGVAFSPDGSTLAAAGGDGDGACSGTPRTVHAARPPSTAAKAPSYGVAFSPDGSTLAAAGDDGKVVLWDAARRYRKLADPRQRPKLRPRRRVQPGREHPRRRRRRREGRALGRCARLPQARHPRQRPKRRLRGRFQPGREHTRGRRRRREGRALGRRARLQQARSPRQRPRPVDGVAFSPDGSTLAAAGSTGRCVLWDARRLREAHRPWTAAKRRRTGSRSARTGARSPPPAATGRWCSGTPRTTTASSQPSTAANGAVNGVAFSPDGSTLAAAGDDGKVRALGRRARLPQAHRPSTAAKRSVYGVAFSPDGSTLAAAGGDGKVGALGRRARLRQARRPSTAARPPSTGSRSARTGARSPPPATTGRSCSGTPRTTTPSSQPSTAARLRLRGRVQPGREHARRRRR